MPAALAVVPPRAERVAIRVNLPGRDEPFAICHAPYAWEVCDHCLRTIAGVLADEMKGSLAAALDKTLASYRAELGGDELLGWNCTNERAHDLALMTQSECWRRQRGAGDAAKMFVAGLDAQMATPAAVVTMPRPRMSRRRRMGVAVLAALAVWVVLWFAVVIWWWL